MKSVFVFRKWDWPELWRKGFSLFMVTFFILTTVRVSPFLSTVFAKVPIISRLEIPSTSRQYWLDHRYSHFSPQTNSPHILLSWAMILPKNSLFCSFPSNFCWSSVFASKDYIIVPCRKCLRYFWIIFFFTRFKIFLGKLPDFLMREVFACFEIWNKFEQNFRGGSYQ